MRSVVAIIAVSFIGNTVATAPDYQCWNFGSTDELRFRYLSTVNNLRKQIAQGTADNKSGKCPKGKNIYKLEWDCYLEMQAQKVVDQCDVNAKGPNSLSMIMEKVKPPTCNVMPIFKKTVEGWWNVVRTEGMSNDAIFNNDKLKTFATLAYGAATRIGCAQKNCNEQIYIACMTFRKGPAMGQAIYEKGNGCSSPKDCTTYVGARCVQQMCVGGYLNGTRIDDSTDPQPNPNPGNKICDSSYDMYSNDAVREKFLTLHNQYRSSVAQGKMTMGNNKNVRPAVQMRKLKYYCELEKSAFNSATRCHDTDGNSGVAENRIQLRNTRIDSVTAAERATNTWRKEISTGLMQQEVGQRNLYFDSLKIPNFAKMIWASHQQMGCAVVTCSTFTNVVCHYTPKGGIVGVPIYQIGVACKRCPQINTTCTSDKLCE